MTLPEGYRLRTATADDIPAIMQMRAAVGWAAHDWALRLAIEPANARCFIVEASDGDAAGVGSGVAYPPLGIVGNMIVMEGHRRRGIGAAVLSAVVERLREQGCSRLELYATREGRPLYERHGFQPIGSGSRATIPRGAVSEAPSNGVDVEEGAPSALDELEAYDRPRFGGSRRALLAVALADAERPTLLARRGGAVAGYAWVRPADGRIGPWVADDPTVAAALVARAFQRTADADELTTNVPMSNEPGVAWLRALGVRPDPWDGRMALGDPIPQRLDTIYGNSVGALG